MLTAVKKALAITADDFDDEISDLIQAALYDLKTNGVNALGMQTDPLIVQAVKTYCRAHFHSPADYDKLLAAYEEQKGHLMNCSGYTVFPDDPEPVKMDDPDLTIRAGVTEIEEEAYENTPFQVVSVPASVTAIGARAFAGCAKLRQIGIAGNPVIDHTAFEGVEGLTMFGPPCGTVETFAAVHGYAFAPMGG